MKLFHEKLNKLDKVLYDTAIANPDFSGLKLIVENLLLFSILCLSSASHLMHLSHYGIISHVISAGKNMVDCCNAVSDTFAECSHNLSAMEKDTLMNYSCLFADYYKVLHNFPGDVSINLFRAMQQDISMVLKSTIELILIFVNAALLVMMHIPQCSYLLESPGNDYIAESMKVARESIMNAIASL